MIFLDELGWPEAGATNPPATETSRRGKPKHRCDLVHLNCRFLLGW